MSSLSSPLASKLSAVELRQAMAANVESGSNRDVLVQKLKSLYRADHQVELLHLHAETDVLLQQLQTIQQQRIDAKHADT